MKNIISKIGSIVINHPATYIFVCGAIMGWSATKSAYALKGLDKIFSK